MNITQKPNAVTRAAMQEAENGNLPRFVTTQELFDDLEENREEIDLRQRGENIDTVPTRKGNP